MCTVAASDEDSKEAEQGEEKVWSLVQLIKESQKSPKALGGQVCPPPLPPVCTTCIMKLLVGHCGRGMEWLHGWLPFAGTHQRRV